MSLKFFTGNNLKSDSLFNQIYPNNLSPSVNKSQGVVDKFITKTCDRIKDKISAVTTFTQLLPLIIADSSDYDFRKAIEHFTGYSLTTEEYSRLIVKIKSLSKSDIHSVQNLMQTVKNEIASEKEQSLIFQKREEARIQELTISKCGEFCTNACERLQRPLDGMLDKEQYRDCLLFYLNRYDSEMRNLFQKFKEFLESSDDFANFRNKLETSGGPNPDTEDDKYLAIARKYVLYSNCMQINVLQKFQSISSAVRMLGEYSEDVTKITKSSVGECLEVPIVTVGLFLLWGAMSIEFLDTAYGDTEVAKEQMISAAISIYSAMLIVAFAREGIPPQFGVDMGITHCIQTAQRVTYTFFHDIAKPIVDFGIYFAKKKKKKSELDFIITKNKTWNEKLYERISSRISISPIRIALALPMLHTFRVADAFLSSLKNRKSIFSGTFKENLQKLSPLPRNGEETKLISLFWDNPYEDYSVANVEQPYGLFFNYEKEIELIYERCSRGMIDDWGSVLSTAREIYHSIRELNYHIGKGNPKIFDDFLAYCIAGKLIDKYYRPCLGNIRQSELASEIYRYINSQPIPSLM